MTLNTMVDWEEERSIIRSVSLQVYVQQHQKDMLYTSHRPKRNILILVTEGSGCHYIDEQIIFVRPGTLLLISDYQTHRFTKGFSWDGLVIIYNEIDLTISENKDVNSTIVKNVREINAIYNVLELLLPDFNYLSDPVASRGFWYEVVNRTTLINLVCKGLSVVKEIEQRPVKSKYLSVYLKFYDLVENHYRSKKNVIDYAECMGVSHKVLNNACIKIKERSAKSIIDVRVITEAKRLLLNSSYSVSQIAEELGFDQPTNLAKYFKKHTYVTPSEFREISCQFASSATLHHSS